MHRHRLVAIAAGAAALAAGIVSVADGHRHRAVRTAFTSASASGAFVRVDQAGVAAGTPSTARVLARGPVAGTAFTVTDAAGSVVARGHAGRNLGAWSARFPHVAALAVPALGAGDYVVHAAGADSPPLHVAPAAALAAPLVAGAVDFFRTQQDGPDVSGALLGRGPSHLTDEHAHDYAQPTYRGGRLVGAPRRLGGASVDVSGGWFDAGDDIKFVETASFADTLLLWTARDHPDPSGAVAAQGRHGADWLLKMVGDGRGTIRYQVGLGDGNARIDGAHDTDWALPENDDRRNERPGDRGYYVEYRPAFVAARPGQPVSPNLAGRTAAALALAAQVFHSSDPAYAARCLRAAEALYARARTRGVGTLLTTSPHAYYPEDEWRDDMELGGAELARAAAQAGDRAGAARYLGAAAHWAQAYMTGSHDGEDTFNLYDVSALAHAELAPLLTGSAVEDRLHLYRSDLLGDLRDQLALGERTAARDPFGLGVPVRDGDTVPHAFGLALTADAYNRLTHGSRYAAFGASQRGWALGANPWGLSFVVGAGSVFPHCLHSVEANVRGSLDGTGAIMRGATVAGPTAAAELAHEGVPDHVRACPPAGGDVYAAFSGHGARYEDAVADSSANEPTDDASALALAALASLA